MSDEPRPRDTTNTILMVVGLVIAVILLVLVWWTVQRSRRARSQDITAASNLRFLVQAAEMYYTDHPGVSSVQFTAIVGTDTRYLQKRYFSTVAQETYSAVILQSTAVTASGISGARTVTYAP